MRWPDLETHRAAVLVRAWSSGDREWFVARARKYAEVRPESIWRGFSGQRVVETQSQTPRSSVAFCSSDVDRVSQILARTERIRPGAYASNVA